MANAIAVTVTFEELQRLEDAAPTGTLMTRWEWAHWRVREKLVAAGIPLLASFLADKLRVADGHLVLERNDLDAAFTYRWTPTPEAA